jgi:eukaryotic-like serine/threonine-protein kinase
MGKWPREERLLRLHLREALTAGKMPEKIGKYEILEQIGVGGFGAVYRGRDPFIKRTVAVKTCQLNDEEIKSRFFREAELAGNLHHRNITTIYDFGVENGIPYIVQEFLSGEDLDKVIKRGDNMTVPRKIEILMAVTEGLSYAHQQAIIHRDIKPANIRILEDGSVKIMDFGIAKSLQTESSLTQTGITLGTSAYLAPEQIRGESLDQRTDVFALGVVAYELLTFRKPFRGEHLSTVLYKILNDTPEPADALAPEVPADLAAVVARAMDKDIGQRYPSMESLRQDLHVIYRQLVGSSSRFTTAPRITQSPRQTSSALDPDATIATPSGGMMRADHITPPSGALARVPAPYDRTPTAASARREGGLELINFRDPSQTHAEGKTAAQMTGRAGGRRGLIALAVVLIAAAGGTALFLYRTRPEPQRPIRAAKPAPTAAPIVFPPPVVGQEPGGANIQPTAPPKEQPAVVAEKKPEPPPRPPRHFKIQFSSIPPATLYVDGHRVGPSIPAKVVDLAEGPHRVRLEAPGLPGYEREIKVGPNSEPRFAYRLPVGFLVIQAPEWVGSSVLIDSKFKGVLGGDGRFQLSSGDHRVTLSREGVAPVTANVTVPEGGDKKVWTPPAPVPHPAG